MTTLGWAFWAFSMFGSWIFGLWVAVAYIAVLPITGYVIRHTHGHGPREVLFDRKAHKKEKDDRKQDRMIVCTKNLNGCEWIAVFGHENIVDSMINRPLYRPNKASCSGALGNVLRGLIGIQWGLIIVACAWQDWNALVISGWIVVCSCVSSWMYNKHHAVKAWLKANQLHVEKSEIVFHSSRRAMLGCLIAANPDESTNWIDPILMKSDDRTQWEELLQEARKKGMSPNQSYRYLLISPLMVSVYY